MTGFVASRYEFRGVVFLKIQFLLHLAHFGVHFNVDADVREFRELAQVGLNAELQILVCAAGRKANAPVDLREAWRSMAILRKKKLRTGIATTGFAVDRSSADTEMSSYEHH